MHPFFLSPVRLNCLENNFGKQVGGKTRVHLLWKCETITPPPFLSAPALGRSINKTSSHYSFPPFGNDKGAFVPRDDSTTRWWCKLFVACPAQPKYFFIRCDHQDGAAVNSDSGYRLRGSRSSILPFLHLPPLSLSLSLSLSLLSLSHARPFPRSSRLVTRSPSIFWECERFVLSCESSSFCTCKVPSTNVILHLNFCAKNTFNKFDLFFSK